MYYRNEMLEDFIIKHFHNGTYDKTAAEKINNQTYYLIDNYSIWSGIWKDIFQSFILCITIIVVAIPEGLPLAVTLSLSFSVRKMMEDNNLVRHMQACETMGGANYICTDKTGTLTRNKMHVVTLYNNGNKVNVNDIDHEHQDNYSNKFTDKYYQNLRDALINNIDVELDGNGDIIMASSSKTDFAFYDLLRGFKENLLKKYTQLDRLKFHSDRKRMSTIVKRDDGKYFIYMKGAPEVVINSCTHYLRPNGEAGTPRSHGS
jgi:magnesium-transporting ATPase (P-type)